MSDYFCPVCDNELPGPIPLCPHCHSLTGFKPAAPVVEDATATGTPGEDAVLPLPSPGVPTEPVDIVEPPAEADAGEPAEDPMAPPAAPADESAPAAAAPPAPVAVPLPPTVLGVPSAPLGSGASGPGTFRPIPQQLQPAGGGGGGAKFWQQPGFWKQPKVLIAGGAVLLVLIIAVVALAGGSDSKKSPTAEPTSAVTSTATVPETSVAETEVATTKPSTTTSSATSTTTTTSSPTTTTLVLALKGTDDFPGTAITVPTALRSSLDQTSRPRELFAVNLEAGQRIRLGLQMTGGGSLALINPGALTLTQSYSTALSGSTDSDGRYTGTFVAAVAGTYGLVITAQGPAETYRLDVGQNGIGVTALQGSDDLPGAPLAVDSTVRSVVDRDMRPREVYAMDAAAGQQLQLTLQVPGGGSLAVINPGGLSLNQAYTTAVSGGTDSKGTYTTVFTPAVTGTYSIVVTASSSGESYSLKVAATKTALSAGQGTDEFPGAPLALGTVVKSIVDQDTRPYEVYAVDLAAGQPIKITVNAPLGASVQLVNPGAVSVKQSFSRALSGGTSSGKFVASFIPAVNGTYSIIVTASAHGVTFDLLVEASGAALQALVGADDVPGVPIEPNGTVQSVVDASTRPFEVFALDLAAGQQVKITLEMPGGGSLSVANPGTTTIKGSYTRAMSGGTSSGKFVGILIPAVDGTYSVIVQASQSGEPYSLTIGPP